MRVSPEVSRMENKVSVSECEIFQGSPYCIYGAEEENIYETIKKRKLPSPEMYDEVFQSKPSQKESEPKQVCDATNCEEGLSSTYGEFKERKLTILIKKCYKIIPLWVKVAVPIIIICITIGYNGLLVAELKFKTKVNTSVTENISSSLSSLSTNTTAKTYSSTFSDITTATAAKTTWNYTNKSWYIKSDTHDTYYCETWELVSNVKFQPLDWQGSICNSIPDCITFIDLYKLYSDDKANYTFYIDQIGNIYEGRGWYCPYVSGELWVALITNNFNIFRPQSELQMRHFYEMVSYNRAFEYFNEAVEEEIVNRCSLRFHTSQCAND